MPIHPDEDTTPDAAHAADGKPILISTAMLKGVMTLVTLAAALAGGILGVDIMIDQDVVTSLVENINTVYGAVMVIIGIVTVLVRAGKNLWKNKDAIKANGLKVTKSSGDYVFDFAPKE